MRKRCFSDFLANFVTKYYKFIIVLSIILIIPALIGFFTTRVNYDMLNYLPEDMETVIGQKELLEDFHKGAFSIIVTENLSEKEVANLTEKIQEVPHVSSAISLGKLTENNVPAEILPDEIYNSLTHDSETLVAVFFDGSTSADETINAISEVRKVIDGHGYVSGMSALVADLRELCGREEIIYIIIAVALTLFVMMILLDNWMVPIIFLVSIGVMILFNMGTNFVFGDISYITKALSAVLQLAVTMDYSIFLWNSYHEMKEKGLGVKAAMSEGIKMTLSSILGSSATTIAGFIALCFMSFTLGFDLGLVMAKGVLFGVIGSVTVLPALILAFDKILEKFKHKPILPKFEKLSGGIVKFYPAFLVLLVLILPLAFFGYQKTSSEVYYNFSHSLPQNMESVVANKKLAEDFNMANMHMILTDAKLDGEKMNSLTKEIQEVQGVKVVINLESLLGADVPIGALPESVVENFKSEKWELSLVLSEYSTASDEVNEQLETINSLIKKYDDSALLIGEASCTKDMINLTDRDFKIVNIVSILVVFLIIAIVERSLILPVILIVTIETAIFINLGLPFYFGNQLSFITPICISTIQLGATVDYAILMTTRYKKERNSGLEKKKAVKTALATSLPSILVSGLGLFAATFGVAVFSDVDMISSICLLIASGALISMVSVALFLPSLLIVFDSLILKTTRGMNKIGKENFCE